MKINIPEPPRWLLMALAAATFVAAVLHNNAYGRVPNGKPLPGGYAGRPPTSQTWPGKCWCRYHGPRGGCMQWHCPGKR